MTTVDSRDFPLEDYMLDDRSSYVKLPDRARSPTAARCSSVTRPGSPRWTSPPARPGIRSSRSTCIPAATSPAIAARIREVLPDAEVIDVEDAAAADLEVIDALIARNLTDDRVFGVMSHFTVDEFYDAERLAALQRRVEERTRPDRARRLGCRPRGRSPRGRARARRSRAGGRSSSGMRAGAPNWRAANGDEDILRKYKRGFFVEWRTADRHKRTLFDRIDLLVDGNAALDAAGAVRGADFRAALAGRDRRAVPRRPVLRPRRLGRAVDEEHARPRPDSCTNYAWCFDCVPEENSLLLEAGGRVVEIPAMDLVLSRPRELLGERTFARFGAEFPIRFDFLDTMGGGNLSLQVHPLTEYIRDTFGMALHAG